MARNQERDEPVSDAEFEELPERINEHFDRVRARLAEELADESQ
ncbi:MAG: hypothetical protein J07HN6_02115 [Halonotius sp. J07HN6]|nr:MAG: hypothetical protein J07HN6_02115 [Halonotius sp. J07HN6]